MLFDIFFRDKVAKAKVMSTEILIKARANKKTLLECIQIARDFEEKLSAYKPNSYISKINKMAGKEPVSCPPLVVDIIKEALKVAEETDGKFDPTIGVLTQKTYGFGTGKEKIPTYQELEEKKSLVNYKDVEIFGNDIMLKKEGMALDLGGIGKGYASQLIAEFLVEKNIPYGLVSIGGEICCYGKNWNIAIQHPRKKEPFAIIKTKKDKTTISTSGDYERYIKSLDNHHILDSKKGRQNHYYSSLTLLDLGFNGGRLDAFTTAFFNTENILDEIKKYDFELLALKRESNDILISAFFIDKVDSLEFL